MHVRLQAAQPCVKEPLTPHATQVYLRMWDVHCSGSGPRSFEVA